MGHLFMCNFSHMCGGLLLTGTTHDIIVVRLKVIPPDSPYKYIFQHNILGCSHQKPKAKGKEDGPLKTTPPLVREKTFSVEEGFSPSAKRPNPVEVTAARLPELINSFWGHCF